MVWAAEGPTGAGSVRAAPVAMARILVVDDHQELAEVIRTVLEEEGHAMEAIDDEQTALERLAATSEESVICDLQMPDVEDGAAVYRTVTQLAPAGGP